MGQTQLLLVVLGVLLVGVAIYVGVTMFQANTVENTRNAIIADLNGFAARAHAYYWKSTTQGGGNKSFAAITMGMIYPPAENANARYFLDPSAPPSTSMCTIVGVGKVVTSNGDSVKVRIQVTEARNITIIDN